MALLGARHDDSDIQLAAILTGSVYSLEPNLGTSRPPGAEGPGRKPLPNSQSKHKLYLAYTPHSPVKADKSEGVGVEGRRSQPRVRDNSFSFDFKGARVAATTCERRPQVTIRQILQAGLPESCSGPPHSDRLRQLDESLAARSFPVRQSTTSPTSRLEPESGKH